MWFAPRRVRALGTKGNSVPHSPRGAHQRLDDGRRDKKVFFYEITQLHALSFENRWGGATAHVTSKFYSSFLEQQIKGVTMVLPHESLQNRSKSREAYEKYGAYGQPIPRLSAHEIGGLASASGIHPDVLGPCRRAAHQLNWYIMFRPIKQSAMFHVGDFDKLPKPMEVKAKADYDTGMVKLKDEADFQLALKDGRIDPAYAETNGLKLDPQLFLVNSRGQRFFSDMDLYEVIHGETRRPVRLGAGVTATQGLGNRRELDLLINILRPLGVCYALIQHGPERQWVKHDHSKPNLEPITAFCPNGDVRIIAARDVDSFLQGLQRNA